MKENNYTAIYKYLIDSRVPESMYPLFIHQQFVNSNPSFYAEYPALFAPAFGYQPDEDSVIQLSIAGYFYYRSVIIADTILDEKPGAGISKMVLAMTACQEETIKILSSFYTLSHPFWQVWNQRKTEFFKAVQIEKQLHIQMDTIPMEYYTQLAEYKAAFGKIALDSLHLLERQANEKTYRLLLESHRLFSVGFQIMDDIEDFKVDFKNGQYNLALHHTYLACKTLGRPQMGYKEIKTFFYLEGIAVKLLKLAISYFDHALNPMKELATIKWTDIIQAKKEEAKRLIREIEGYICVTKTRVAAINRPAYRSFDGNIENIQGPYRESIKYNLKMIAEAWQNGFGELQHFMHLPQSEGFENEKEIHCGDVFQRAIVLDLLIDINNRQDAISLDSLIHTELDDLINIAKKDPMGGWPYFPTVAEIAADADDLGQMLQCLSKMNNVEAINQQAVPLINLLLEDRSTADGGVETWIVPKTNQNTIQKTQEAFNTHKWGKGPDNEVVANFLLGLAFADEILYESQINKGIDFLINRQDPDGFWNSRWYYGPYYGTMVALKLFRKLNRQNHAAVAQAVNFLIHTQSTNGGWGNGDRTDCLQTSFALIALQQVPSMVPGEVYSEGANYLCSNLDDVSKLKVPFIRPKVGSPYASETMTRAYVTHALTGVNKIETATATDISYQFSN